MNHPPAGKIANRKSSIVDPHGFTLIELLVVISVTALLLSILMPALRQARRQAGAMTRQAKLRQWGVLFAHRAIANEGDLIVTPDYMGQTAGSSPVGTGVTGEMYDHWAALEGCYGPEIRDLYLCPVASRMDNRYKFRTTGRGRWIEGGTFSARWGSRSFGRSSGSRISTRPVRGPRPAASALRAGPCGCGNSKTTDARTLCRGAPGHPTSITGP